MVDYSLRFNETPRDQILTMLRWAGERNDAKAKERKDEYMKLMQMLGRGVGALKANADYKDYKYWQNEGYDLDKLESDYDKYLNEEQEAEAINATDALLERLSQERMQDEKNPYYLSSIPNANQSDYFMHELYQLGLGGV